MSALLAGIGLVSSVATGIGGFFSAKKQQKAIEEQAQSQLDYDLQYADDLYNQRLEEIESYEETADQYIGSQKAQQGASGAGNEGSALLASVTSEVNKTEGLETLGEDADEERTRLEEQAQLNYDATINQADAVGTQATTSLISSTLQTASLASGIFGGTSVDDTLTESAIQFDSTSSSFDSTLGINYSGYYDLGQTSSSFDQSNVGFSGFFN